MRGGGERVCWKLSFISAGSPTAKAAFDNLNEKFAARERDQLYVKEGTLLLQKETNWLGDVTITAFLDFQLDGLQPLYRFSHRKNLWSFVLGSSYDSYDAEKKHITGNIEDRDVWNGLAMPHRSNVDEGAYDGFGAYAALFSLRLVTTSQEIESTCYDVLPPALVRTSSAAVQYVSGQL